MTALVVQPSLLDVARVARLREFVARFALADGVTVDGQVDLALALLERARVFRDPTQRVEATTTPEGAKGWADPAGSAQVRTGGHGLDVAPDASPEGVRAETRRREQDGGGEPSNAPNAATVMAERRQG